MLLSNKILILFLLSPSLGCILMDGLSEPACEPREMYIPFKTVIKHANAYYHSDIPLNTQGQNLRVTRCINFITPCSRNTVCQPIRQKTQRGVIEIFSHNKTYMVIDFLEDTLCECRLRWQSFEWLPTFQHIELRHKGID